MALSTWSRRSSPPADRWPPDERRARLGRLAAGLALAAVALAAAGCGEHEYERLGRELAERLVSEGYAVDRGLVYAPRGPVPHWVVELEAPGGEADAEALCAHVEATVTFDGEAPYLVRVSYQPAGTVECGWGKATDGGSPSQSGSPVSSGSPNGLPAPSG